MTRTFMPIVLVVDDDPELRVLLETCLRVEGFDVRTAQNGSDALSVAQQTTPCLILLDLMMPVMDGIEFRRRQQRAPALRDVPVRLSVCPPQRPADSRQPGLRRLPRQAVRSGPPDRRRATTLPRDAGRSLAGVLVVPPRRVLIARLSRAHTEGSDTNTDPDTHTDQTWQDY